jgi:phage-related protein
MAFESLPLTMAPVLPALQGLGTALQELFNAAQPVLAALGATIAGVLGVGAVVGMNIFAAAINRLGPIVATVINQIEASIRVVATVLTEVTALVTAVANGDWSAAWTAIQNIAKAAVDYVMETLNNMLAVGQTVATGVYDAIKNALDDLNVDASAVMDTIKAWWETAWDALAQAFTPVTDGIAKVQEAIDGIKKGIEDFKGWISTISIPNPFAGLVPPAWWPGANGAGQLGITYAQGGLYTVGEAGRELVMLPRGAQVIPHRQTENILAGGGGGVTVIIQHANMSSEQDSWRLAQQIDELRRRRRA